MAAGKRKFAQIIKDIWRDTDWKSLTMPAQWLYKALLSQDSINYAGIIPLTVRRWSKLARDLTVEVVEKAIEELSQARFVVVDWDTEEVLIRSFIRNDGLWEQPRMMGTALRNAVEVQSPSLRAALAHELLRVLEMMQAKLGGKTPSEAVAEMMDSTDQTAKCLVAGPDVSPGPTHAPGDSPGERTENVEFAGVGVGLVTEVGTAPTPNTGTAHRAPARGRMSIARLNDTSGSIEAHGIVARFSKGTGGIPANLDGEIRGVVQQLIERDIAPDVILGALELWQASDRLYPSNISNFVLKAAAKSKATGISKPTEKGLSAQAIAERIISEGHAL